MTTREHARLKIRPTARSRAFRPEVVWVKVSALRTNPRNVRTHSKQQTAQVAKSIAQFGFLVPIVVDENGIILSGHARLAAATALGLNSVPTVCASGLNETERRAYMLANNKIAANAGFDRKALAIELGELAIELPLIELDLTITGFEAAEIDAITLASAEHSPSPVDVIPLPERVVVNQRGDLWQLGSHRLLCGDARSVEDLDRLMAGQQAKCAFIDPPYNCPVNGHVGGRGRTQHDEFAFASGEMTRDEFVDFLRASTANLARVSLPGAVHFVCMDWRNISELIKAAREVYGTMLNLCVWGKTSPGQGAFYRSQHELVGVFRVAGAPHQNNVNMGRFRNRSNLWTYPGVNSFGQGRDEALASHPTVKPSAMVAEALRDCTTRGDLVLDTFLGSGTTLIAAETVARRCNAIEYEPGFVDVAVRRWQAMTKLDAVLEGDGRTFREVAEDRGEPPDQAEAELIQEVVDDGWVALCEGIGQ